MPIYESPAEVADKIEWEGGIWGALDYGIRAIDVPEEMQEDWELLVALFNAADAQWRHIRDTYGCSW